MKVGDLVNFHSNSWIFDAANKRYTNPGVVLKALHTHSRSPLGLRYEVMWADQKITKEYASYLQRTKETNE